MNFSDRVKAAADAERCKRQKARADAELPVTPLQEVATPEIATQRKDGQLEAEQQSQDKTKSPAALTALSLNGLVARKRKRPGKS
jgi:hypothetical protein